MASEIAKNEAIQGRVISRDELRTCGTCREVKDDVRVVIDPISAEVYGEEVEVQLCDRCYGNAADDV
jgi:hypothetical protein